MNAVYWISGSDTARTRAFLKTLPSTLRVDVVDVLPDGVGYEALMDALFGVSLLGASKLVVAHDPHFLVQPGHPQALHTIAQLASIPPGHFLAVLSTKSVDGRTKVAQAFKKTASVHSFDAFKEWEMPKFTEWLNREAQQLGVRFQPDALQLLGENLGVDTGIARQMLDTLITYDPGQSVISVERVIAVLGPKAGSYHRLTEALRCQNKPVIAEEIFNLAADDSAKVLGILSATVHQFSLIRLLGESGYAADDIAKVIEKHPYTVKVAMPELKRAYTVNRIRQIVVRLNELDIGFKSGRISADGLGPLLVDCLTQ